MDQKIRSDEVEKKEYVAPKLIQLGNIVEITYGGVDGWGSDHMSRRFRSD
ncbi:hypothetical protein IC620_13730 [Hazenella sp. IB182357]|uniref:Lasso RiPP family leader peptide-containing protein n=1 Tax=Polycladospora coralii TaxID=2771432 RepID=A0A926RU05_9BACL|nr:hypothetical protein [Polycladospora coralii]MBD1373410.1 hypothetical protein [Polycladospora coralii]MBS7531188.1 hypothetical protein [Polycladospora coralii]